MDPSKDWIECSGWLHKEGMDGYFFPFLDALTQQHRETLEYTISPHCSIEVADKAHADFWEQYTTVRNSLFKVVLNAHNL